MKVMYPAGTDSPSVQGPWTTAGYRLITQHVLVIRSVDILEQQLMRVIKMQASTAAADTQLEILGQALAVRLMLIAAAAAVLQDADVVVATTEMDALLMCTASRCCKCSLIVADAKQLRC